MIQGSLLGWQLPDLQRLKRSFQTYKQTNVEVVKLEKWHFNYFLGKEEADKFHGKAFGRTLMDGATPLCFGGIYFEENGSGEAVAIMFLHGGPNQIFIKKYITIVLRAFLEAAKISIEMGIEQVYAIADKHIDKASSFIRWMGGKSTGENDENGEIWVIKLEDIPFIKGR